VDEREQDSDQPEPAEGGLLRIGPGAEAFQLQPGWSVPDGERPVKRRGPVELTALPAPPKSNGRTVLLVVGAVVVLALVAAASYTAGANSTRATEATAALTNPPADGGSFGAQTVSGDIVPTNPATGPAIALVPTTAPAAAAPPPAQTVTYACTGHAGDGVDITYGSEGSNSSAHHLPFSETVPLNATAGYFAVTAQLQGNGTVTCSTVVNWTDDSDDAQSVTQTGTASGGYDIASAEVCGDFEGGWQVC
jgi:hypothetical protein